MKRAFKFLRAALALAALGFFAAACDTDGVAVETFTVTYLTNGGSPVPPSTVPKDSRLTLPTPPTRSGMDFDAWHTTQSLNAPFDINAPITRNMTLHAKWNKAEGPPAIEWHASRVEAAITEAVTLTFAQEVELDIDMITIGPSTHSSHAFKGAAEKISVVPVEGTAYWTLSLTTITDGWIEISIKGVPDLDAAPARVQALNPYSYLYLRFYPNALDAAFPGSSAEYFEVRGTRGDVVGEDDMPPKPTRPGHEFSRWTRRPDGGGGEVGPGQGITNLDAHAQWDPLFFNITFDMNGADTPQIASITGVPWGGSAPLPAPPPTREGHYFAGWFHATTAGPEYAEGFSDVRADIPALARWIPHEFTINFEMNGAGSAPIAPMRNVQWNTSRALPSQPPTRAGHDFLGWHSEREGGTRYTAFNNVRENITAWARWQAHTFTVTLRPDPQHLPAPNGSPYGAYTNVKWGEGPNAQDPTRDGYYFIGWFDGNGARCDLTDMRLGKGETLELWARWTQNVYTITFMMNGADSAQIPAITNVPWSTSRPFPPEPTRAGYAFGGWHSAESGGQEYLGGFNNVTSNIVAWARWTPLAYTISFVMNDADSAQIPAMTNVPWGASRDLPPAPIRAGHDFAGWWSEDNGGAEYKAFVDVKEHITARARWEPHRFNIEFRMNGAESAQIPTMTNVPWGSTVALPPEPTRAGYVFGGWHSAESGGQEYLGAFSNVRANIVAWARWIPIHTVTFYRNDG
ncbi:MAG: InlB B-repeat-containing protein, partial [Treponema sp.]|nr:InlB B-repeat-containing protein [Treponema sp.]